jgi:hypothetical protein
MKLKIDTTKAALGERRTDWQKTTAHKALSLIPRSQPAELIPWQFQRLGLSSLGDRALVASPSDRAQHQLVTARQAMREGA